MQSPERNRPASYHGDLYVFKIVTGMGGERTYIWLLTEYAWLASAPYCTYAFLFGHLVRVGVGVGEGLGELNPGLIVFAEAWLLRFDPRSTLR